jgi:hypothetical protein
VGEWCDEGCVPVGMSYELPSYFSVFIEAESPGKSRPQREDGELYPLLAVLYEVNK